MNKEEAKQYIRNQIKICIKSQSKENKDMFYLYYNNSYLRALKLSKIIGKPVDVHDQVFDSGKTLFGFNIDTKDFYFYDIIENYLIENYTNDYFERKMLVEEVLYENSKYKDYTVY